MKFKLLLLILLTSCSVFEDIVVKVKNNDLVFQAEDYDDNFLKNGEYLEISSFGISKTDCERDCLYWDWGTKVPNNIIKNGSFTYKDLDKIEKVVIQSKKKLTSGKYNLGFTIAKLDKNDKVIDSWQFNTHFRLEIKDGKKSFTQD